MGVLLEGVPPGAPAARGAGRTGPHYTLFSFSLLSFIFVCVGLRNFYFTDFFFFFEMRTQRKEECVLGILKQYGICE